MAAKATECGATWDEGGSDIRKLVTSKRYWKRNAPKNGERVPFLYQVIYGGDSALGILMQPPKKTLPQTDSANGPQGAFATWLPEFVEPWYLRTDSTADMA